MDPNEKGIEVLSFIDEQAECSGSDSEEGYEESQSDLSDLIDNTECEQGNSAELFAQQEALAVQEHIRASKRKLKLSFRNPLQCITSHSNRTPSRAAPKRRKLDDSGYNEDILGEVAQVDENGGSEGYGSLGSQNVSGRVQVCNVNAANKENDLCGSFLRAGSRRATQLAIFKDKFNISFNSLTRPFKNDKTCCNNWVGAMFGARDELLEASKMLLQRHCDYLMLLMHTCKLGFMALYLLEFKHAKSRETIRHLFQQILQIEKEEMFLEPPKLKSLPAATFWWKISHSASAYIYGELPDWIARQTSLSHQRQDDQPFDLSQMVQWAYDHNYTDEPTIAYNYARMASEDSNAAAFLRCNSQVKFVKECAQMTKYYKTAEMREMSMGKWIKRALDEISGTGDWKDIINFLKYQGINFLSFLASFKDLLHGIPKRNCLVIVGPPNTGKSMFVMSLMKALKGRVLSFVNSKSHFWLQPLNAAKIAVLDDATKATWSYIDTYLRNGLDGTPVSLDMKHRAPIQICFPPLLITTNVQVMKDPLYMYLHSRLMCFEFPNPFPLNEAGQPALILNELSWKSFFARLWRQLDLSDAEDAEDGEPPSPFRCCARSADRHL
ncbi:E1 protein [Bos taurus papillomavirus 6]|uniref:Replication protein E1 n=1 Tax=Bos taurus papillomavirus 6 TaxID=10563 RepID=VE1_BPV6|nr:RecName: Full=Replication protein E1; AltName: Full=ATP-dependent helicase E1 [Bos taurus papillomavirus 6]CAF05687.1 E1 protein [Bos taurus papillomavirus 6]